MNTRILSLAFCLIGLLTACQKQKPEDPLQPTEAATYYASLLQMQNVKKGETICRIMNPWQPERIAIQYLLAEQTMEEDELQELENQFGPFQLLYIPLDRQTITASCHLWLLNQLQALPSVKVVCDAEYILLPEVQKALTDHTMQDGGSSMAPNAEVIRSANSPCIWVSPYETTSQQIIAAQLPDIAIIYCADYMENSPLARAEWMRFYGRLVGKAAQADSMFQVVESRYLSLTADTVLQPKLQILAELPYAATWYVPGGRSTLGQMYHDARFHYPWAEDTHGGSLSLSPEAVFECAHDADLWIFKHYDTEQEAYSMDWLVQQNTLFHQFKAACTGNVFGCNTARCDYFDATPFRPDWLLREFRFLQLGQTDSLIYFHRLL